MSAWRRAWLMVGALVLLLLVSTVVPAVAGGRVVFGFGFGFPFWYPYAAYPYPYPYPAYAPPAVVESSPPVYVEREAPLPAPPPQYWYYCEASQGYYPYVRECPGGWVQVPPQPSAAPR